MTRVRLNDLAKRVNNFAQHYNPYEYIDCGANIDYFRDTLENAPEVVIEYLLDAVEDLMERN